MAINISKPACITVHDWIYLRVISYICIVVISQQWNGTGSWNHSLWKTKAPWSFIVNVMVRVENTTHNLQVGILVDVILAFWL